MNVKLGLGEAKEAATAFRLAELLALGRRDQMLQIVCQQWLKKDLVKAGAALQKSSLYDERKRFLQPQAGME